MIKLEMAPDRINYDNGCYIMTYKNGILTITDVGKDFVYEVRTNEQLLNIQNTLLIDWLLNNCTIKPQDIIFFSEIARIIKENQNN